MREESPPPVSPAPPVTTVLPVTAPPPRSRESDAEADEETARVRPYMLTRGRTRARSALRLDTMVSSAGVSAAGVSAAGVSAAGVSAAGVSAAGVSAAGVSAAGSFAAAGPAPECDSIVGACSSPRSVAEIAAALTMPLGVARVLVSDAAEAGLVTVHRTADELGGGQAHLQLMERVLSGLRRL